MNVEHSFENATKAILYLTSVNDSEDAKELFKKKCNEKECNKKYYCDKIHKNDVNQMLVHEIIDTLQHWDSLSDDVENNLCLIKCKFDRRCKNGSKCTYLHTKDSVQSFALYLRYNFNCSFKYDFIWE